MDEQRLQETLKNLDQEHYSEADKLEVHEEYRELTEVERLKMQHGGVHRNCDEAKLLREHPEWCDGFKWGMILGARRTLSWILEDDDTCIRAVFTGDGIGEAPEAAPAPATAA